MRVDRSFTSAAVDLTGDTVQCLTSESSVPCSRYTCVHYCNNHGHAKSTAAEKLFKSLHCGDQSVLRRSRGTELCGSAKTSGREGQSTADGQCPDAHWPYT